MRIAALVGLFAALFAASSAFATDLAAPTGPVVLEVTGLVSNTNSGAAADFDMAMLDGLGSTVTVTTTPWYSGAKSFSGPLGRDLLQAVGATGTQLKVTALNDYVTIIPISDFEDYDVILATRLDDTLMSVREKGPIFVIYPFDQQPSLNNETYYGRSAWQVKSIEVF